MPDSRFGEGNDQNFLEHFVIPEGKESIKDCKTCQKDSGTNLNKFSPDKDGII